MKNMENKSGSSVSSFLLALNLTDSDQTAQSIAALKMLAVGDDLMKPVLVEAILGRIRQMPVSKFNPIVASHLWRQQLFGSKQDVVEKFLADGLSGLDHTTQAGILRAYAQLEKPSPELKDAMKQFLLTKPTGRPLLATAIFFMKHHMDEQLANAFEDEKYASRVHSGLLRIQKEVDKAFATDPKSAEDERFYLTAISKLRDFLTKALGADGEIFKISPLSMGSSDFYCSSCGRKIKVASGRTDARMSVNCSHCGSRMHGPPDTE